MEQNNDNPTFQPQPLQEMTKFIKKNAKVPFELPKKKKKGGSRGRHGPRPGEGLGGAGAGQGRIQHTSRPEREWLGCLDVPGMCWAHPVWCSALA